MRLTALITGLILLLFTTFGLGIFIETPQEESEITYTEEQLSNLITKGRDK